MAGILEGTRVLFSAPLDGRLDAILKVVREHGLEGVVAKRIDSRYEAGRRSLAWQKFPLKPKQEFVIGAYRPEGGKLELILVGYYENGELLFAGKVHQGLNPVNRPEASERPQTAVERAVSVRKSTQRPEGALGEGVTAEEMGDYIWLKPETVAEIKFTEWTSGGVLRHAEFVGLRDDKEAAEVTKEVDG